MKLLLKSLIVASIFSAIGCKTTPPGQPAAIVVTVSNPVMQEVMEWDNYSGRLESPRTVNVTARVSGIIKEAPFKEGSLVKANDPLFVLDEEPFKVALERYFN